MVDERFLTDQMRRHRMCAEFEEVTMPDLREPAARMIAADRAAYHRNMVEVCQELLDVRSKLAAKPA